MRIRELLVQKSQIELKSIQSDLSLLDAARILCANNIGALPVVGNEDNIVGIISERDLVRSLVKFQDQCLSKSISDIMITSVIVCRPDDLMDDVYEIMSAKNIRHIPVVEDEKLHAMLSIRDFEIAHKRLKSQSLSDSLTGMHNLRHLLNILDGEFNRYRRFRSPLSVATIRIDRFAEISTSKGHVASDDLLKKMSAVFVEQTRAYDSIGRTADDQFAIVFPNTDPKTSMRACDRLLKAVRTHVATSEDSTEWSTISIGIAHADHEICEGMSMLKWAGELAQRATEAGGDCIEAPKADGLTTAGSDTGSPSTDRTANVQHAATASRLRTH
jgi:diguanylate cyclase (GGDEF)-like protein